MVGALRLMMALVLQANKAGLSEPQKKTSSPRQLARLLAGAFRQPGGGEALRRDDRHALSALFGCSVLMDLSNGMDLPNSA